ncbi:MAG: COX15/CtaA family protein [Cyclobacteriaceae bacterium]
MLNSNSAIKINLITIIAVYFLILVGGIVRNMESGMGCPDWPKCFGAYIPPTTDEGLPENYQEMYVEKRVKKNIKLSNLLSDLGLNDLSETLLNDKKIYKSESFSVEKAWIEYINRLIGVVIGFLILLNFFMSFWIKKKVVRLLALSSLVLVLFQGWVGSIVVSANLLPGFITFHMFLALLLVSLLIIQHVKSREFGNPYASQASLIIALLVLFIIQLFLGVNVREQVDILKSLGIEKSSWISEMNFVFYIHRSFSIVIIGLIGWLFYQTNKNGKRNPTVLTLVTIIVCEVIIGAIMAYFDFPLFTQAIHLLLGSLAFGIIVHIQAISMTKINY